MRHSGRWRVGLALLGCAVGVGLLASLFSRADAAATWTAASSSGPLVLIALVPFAFGLTADAWGMVVLLRALGHRVTLAQMLPVRLASEALHISMPAGFVAAETATAAMLHTRHGVPIRDGIVATLARKWLVMRAHAIYIVGGGLAGSGALLVLSRGLLGGTALPWMVIGSALVPLSLSAGVAAGLLGRSTFTRLYEVLGRLPSSRLRAWLERTRHDALATDAQATRLRAERGATWHATLSFLATWCFESLESALLLHLVGVNIDLGAVFAIEAGLSLVRSAAVIAPSGLGVVDLGYATVLPMLGADAGGTPAFVLLKRAKEAAWVLIGYASLALGPARSARPRGVDGGVAESAPDVGESAAA